MPLVKRPNVKYDSTWFIMKKDPLKEFWHKARKKFCKIVRKIKNQQRVSQTFLYIKDHKNQETNFPSLMYDLFRNVQYNDISSTCKKIPVDFPFWGNLVNVVPWQGEIWLISKITWPCQYYVFNTCGGLRLDSLPRDVFAV